MIPRIEYGVKIEFSPISAENARQFIDEAIEIEGGFYSRIGHTDTAAIVSRLLGIECEMRRDSISIQPGDRLLVAQYSGPRLPEGATMLPEGARIEFWLAKVEL
jgi:hypothetical protein